MEEKKLKSPDKVVCACGGQTKNICWLPGSSIWQCLECGKKIYEFPLILDNEICKK